jgi:hypothetical protein
VSRPDFTFGDLPEADPDTIEQVLTPDPPRRPVLVEFATAILVVGGVFGVLQKVVNPLVASPAPLTVDPVLLVALALDGLSIAAGILVRRGRTWVVAANVAALFAFLYLTLLNPVGVVFGALYLFVVVATFLSRDWFRAMADWRVTVAEDRLRR